MYKSIFSNVGSNYRHLFIQLRFRSSHYDVLGVGRLASQKEIKIAYYKKCKELHPDKNASNPKAHTQFVSLNEAYSILSKPESRRDYDQRYSTSFNYPNPTNVYHNHTNRARYTYPNPFDAYNDDHRIHEERMRFYREQMRYSNFYRPGQEHQDAKPKDIPFRTLVTVGLIISTIFLFDALFVTLTYNHDINNLQRAYAPVYNRRWNRNRDQANVNNQQEFAKEEVDSRQFEADIDEKIRDYKEYESKTNVRIYKLNPQDSN